jgi:hypothetical protein
MYHELKRRVFTRSGFRRCGNRDVEAQEEGEGNEGNKGIGKPDQVNKGHKNEEDRGKQIFKQGTSHHDVVVEALYIFVKKRG